MMRFGECLLRCHSVTVAREAIRYTICSVWGSLSVSFGTASVDKMQLYGISFAIDQTRFVFSSSLRCSCSRSDHPPSRCTCWYTLHPPCAWCTYHLQMLAGFPPGMLSTLLQACLLSLVWVSTSFSEFACRFISRCTVDSSSRTLVDTAHDLCQLVRSVVRLPSTSGTVIACSRGWF
jgi:hypothetical protein